MRAFPIVAAGVALVSVLMVGSCSFTRVTSGHVGVKVNNLGSGAGVSQKALGVGWYFTPPSVDIYEYPVYSVPYTFQDITFQDKTGLSISANVSVAYQADPVLAPRLFQKYRVGIEPIVLGALRNNVKAAIATEAATMNVEDIYGAGKATLIAQAQRRVQQYFAPFGLQIEQMQWASNINLPQTIQARINERVANEQEALAAQASVATREAEARAAVATAEGKARALQIEQAALQSNPQVLQLRAIEKWDGELPTYVGGSGPVPFIGSAVK